MNLGGPPTRQDRIVTLSLCCVHAGHWTRIEAGRTGREAYLALDDGQRAVGSSPLGLSALDVDGVLHLGELHGEIRSFPPVSQPCFRGPPLGGVGSGAGGLHRLSPLAAVDEAEADEEVMAKSGEHFGGCIRELHVNGQWIPLSQKRGWTGWQVSIS
jgi:hypothetical protein